jgi:UPF0271 protein
MVKTHTVQTLAGNSIPIQADTVCIHGDGAHAVAFAQKIKKTLLLENIGIRASGKPL